MKRLFKKKSIQGRLVIQLSAIAGLLSFTLFMLIQIVAERAAIDTQDNILKSSATLIADSLYTDNGLVRLELPYSSMSMLGTISQDRVFYNVFFKGKTLTGYEDLPQNHLSDPRINSAFSTFYYKGEEVLSVTLEDPLD